MSTPFIGQIDLFAGNFAPRGYATCQGQLLSISQNTALFSILGTTYGGDGRTTFGLPNLESRAPMHPGRGPGLSQRRLGERSGSPSVPLNEAENGVHSLFSVVFAVWSCGFRNASTLPTVVVVRSSVPQTGSVIGE